jgi:hypothetical protein
VDYHTQRGSVDVGVLDWFKEETMPAADFDLVIGSDILFFRGTVTPVASAVLSTLSPGGVALLADPCRGSSSAVCEDSQPPPAVT